VRHVRRAPSNHALPGLAHPEESLCTNHDRCLCVILRSNKTEIEFSWKGRAQTNQTSREVVHSCAHTPSHMTRKFFTQKKILEKRTIEVRRW
jgi:hypothetical protein